jgi:hypothetical protein
VAIAVLALAAGAAQAWVLHDLQRLPSPLFGGDVSYQSGCIRSIVASGNPMASCSCSGALPGYLPLYGTLAAVLVWVTRLPVVNAMFVLSVLIHALSTAAVTLVVGRHVSARAGVIVACLWAVLQQAPALHYTEFAGLAVVPVFFDALLRWLREPRARHAVYLGLGLGVLGYAHAVAFVSAVMVTGMCGLWLLLSRIRVDGLVPAAKAAGIGLAIAGAGAALSLGYWYKPLFVYHGHTSLHYTAWNGGPSFATLGDQLHYLQTLLAMAVQPRPWSATIIHVLFLAGVVTLAFAGPRRRFAPIAVVSVATLAWMLHFFVTMPVLHTHFVPDYVRRMLWAFVLVLVAGIPVTLVLDRLSQTARASAVFTAVAVTCGLLYVGANGMRDDEQMLSARDPHPEQFVELASWAAANTRPDDVLLSTNELSFAWAALTGRKTLVSRRAQNDAFLDLDTRNADAAVILYGHDDRLRHDRLARWKVRWVLWTTDWVDGEYFRRGNMEPVTIDPLCWFSDSTRDRSVASAGLSLTHVNTWVDPAMQAADIPRFDMTQVTAANYTRPERPWSTALDTLLVEAWHYDEDGHRLATVYRVRGE